MLKILDTKTGRQGRGQDINALIHTLLTDYLSTQEFAGLFFCDDLDMEGLSARVILGMV